MKAGTKPEDRPFTLRARGSFGVLYHQEWFEGGPRNQGARVLIPASPSRRPADHKRSLHTAQASNGARVEGAMRHGATRSRTADCCHGDDSPLAGRAVTGANVATKTSTGFSTAGSLPTRASDKGKPGESRRRKAPRLPFAR